MNAFLERALGGEVIVNMGQLTVDDERALKNAVKKGLLVKWRGYWFPIAGSQSGGLGLLKTCYGLPGVRESLP